MIVDVEEILSPLPSLEIAEAAFPLRNGSLPRLVPGDRPGTDVYIIDTDAAVDNTSMCCMHLLILFKSSIHIITLNATHHHTITLSAKQLGHAIVANHKVQNTQ
jgi:hypothetical protein